MSIEEKVAREEEKKGLFVIRAFESGCFDLWTLPQEYAKHLKPIEVKGLQADGRHDKLSKDQFEMFLKLQKDGRNPEVRYVDAGGNISK